MPRRVLIYRSLLIESLAAMASPRQAIRILEQARDMLMARLIEEIVAEEETILDDAEGRLFAGVIERIHDQIGNRLSNVNAMLAQLSTAADSLPTEVAAADRPMPPESLVTTIAGRLPPELIDSASIPASHSSGNGNSATQATAVPADTPGTDLFARFAQEIEAERIEAAAALLATLFSVSLAEAMPLAAHFHQRQRDFGDAIRRSKQLRREVAAGEVNNPLWILWECFGLQGPQAIRLLQTLRANQRHW